MNIYGTLQPKNNINGGINVASMGGGGGTSDFDTKIIPYAERISANEESIEDINTAIENHTEQIANNTESLTYLENEVDSNTQSINNLGTSVNNINQTVLQHSEDITNLFISVSNGKQTLASAITDKGVETEASDSFLQMATNILNISTGASFEIIGDLSVAPVAFDLNINEPCFVILIATYGANNNFVIFIPSPTDTRASRVVYSNDFKNVIYALGSYNLGDMTITRTLLGNIAHYTFQGDTSLTGKVKMLKVNY